MVMVEHTVIFIAFTSQISVVQSTVAVGDSVFRIPYSLFRIPCEMPMKSIRWNIAGLLHIFE